MNAMATTRFAGWFTLDVRVVLILLVFSAAIALLVVALRLRGRRWDEHVVMFLAVFALVLVAATWATNWLAPMPAWRIETLFAVP